MVDFPLEIYWTIPLNLPSNFDKIRIYKSRNEDKDYILRDTIDLNVNGVVQTKYVDTEEILLNKDYLFYYIRFYDSVNNIESNYYLTTYPLTPRELRLSNEIKRWMGPLLTKDLTDTDFMIGLKYAVQLYNQIPPVTSFTFRSFPRSQEALLIFGAASYSILNRYLGVALKDFNYSDQGLSLTVDRGAKIQTAIDKINAIFSDYVHWAKLDQAYGPSGVGTVPLPISLGGRIGNITSILDLFNAVGR